MAGLLVVLIIAGCVAYQLLKSTLIKSFSILVSAVCAVVTAFGFFELLANLFISRSILVPWAMSLSFILLFVLAFAVLQTIVSQLTRQRIELALLPDRIGRVVCGIFLGFIVSGLLLTALAMAPLPTKYPYQRFDHTDPNPEKPKKVLLNADGFVARYFSIISSGSLGGKKSFAALHPAFLDELFLNRHNLADKVSTITSPDTLKIPQKAVWSPADDIKNLDGKPVPSKSGHTLIAARVGITSKLLKQGGNFTLSQLRLICKQKDDAQKPLAGKGTSIYPLGHLRTSDQLVEKRLNDQIKLESADFKNGLREIDFAFYLPNGFVPVLVEFKQNALAQLPPPLSAEQTPAPLVFILASDCTITKATLHPVASAKIHGLELAAGPDLLTGLSLVVADPNQWLALQTDRSINPPDFNDGKFAYVKAELEIEKTPLQEEPNETEKKPAQQRRAFLDMFRPLSGCKLLSLKCSNPPTGSAISADQLPALIDTSGYVHHPVGIIAAGVLDDQTTIYEVDYCSLTSKDIQDGLTLAEDGSVARPFPDSVWLPQQVQKISEFYVLYLVKENQNTIITAVKPADSQLSAGFQKFAGFLVK